MKKVVSVGLMVGLIVLLSVLVGFKTKHAETTTAFAPSDTLKTAAFIILENHCNACHQKKKPQYVFTLNNMDAFAASINLEVFITRKMPKGKENALLANEEETLKRWLDVRLPTSH